MAERNLALPGNPRYQPKGLIDYFGYDNLYRMLGLVELANLNVLYEVGVMPEADYVLLNDQVIEAVLSISTTEVDKREREVTKHDVRAWVQLAKERMPASLARWVHVPLTSYDALDTARVLQFSRAYDQVTRPAIRRLLEEMANLVDEQADTLQIGRTHGQHALPITVGFWLATVLSRWLYNYQQLEQARSNLVGKISGAVGASNAITGLRLEAEAIMGESMSYEQRVLAKVGLQPARISTQILPPEPMAYFLFAAVSMSASIGQFGRDARNLMRSEIGEFSEPFVSGQVGSSTMAHKRNPITFEGLEGAWVKNQAEFLKVTATLISEHQRDLVGSSVARDFATILVNLQTQLDTLLRASDGAPLIRRLGVDRERLQSNFVQSSGVILAEPMYIALQMAGYEGDAHELVNHTLVRLANEQNQSLAEVMTRLAAADEDLAAVWEQVPEEVRDLLHYPEQYVGNAADKARDITGYVRSVLGEVPM